MSEHSNAYLYGTVVPRFSWPPPLSLLLVLPMVGYIFMRSSDLDIWSNISPGPSEANSGPPRTVDMHKPTLTLSHFSVCVCELFTCAWVLFNSPSVRTF